MSMAVLEELSRRRGVDAAEPEILANHRTFDDTVPSVSDPTTLNTLAIIHCHARNTNIISRSRHTIAY